MCGSAAARAQLGCDALEGISRGVLADPDKYADPVWVERVVRMIVAAL